ncbi:MAG: hypothetical protein JNM10_18690, partial [Planctomycetia bacterium]|nr:hypothetical protein [Planctomycetia bacterium]
GVLARRAPRLVADDAADAADAGLPSTAPRTARRARGVEPVAGLVVESVLADGLAPAWLAVLVPDY